MTLRKYLTRKYPNMMIPPLLFTKRKLTEKALAKKEMNFTRFIIDLLRSKHLRGSYFLQEFLTIQDQKAFEKVVKEREKELNKGVPNRLEDMVTCNGIAKIKTLNATNKFCMEMPKFADNHEIIMKNIVDISKKIVFDSRELAKTLHMAST